MPGISTLLFAGVKPAVRTENAQGQIATVAHNATLRDTALRPTIEPALYAGPRKDMDVAATGDKRRGLYLTSSLGCCPRVITFASDTSVLEVPAPGGCIGFGQLILFPCDCSEPTRYFPCEDESYPLVVPQPVKPPVAALAGLGAMRGLPAADYRSPDDRIYTYTWVDQFGVESPPAPPSRQLLTYDDETVNVSGFSAPPPNAACLRLYRTVYTLIDQEQTPLQSATFQLVTELPATTTSFADNRRGIEMDLGTLMTEHDCPPPCMTQVVYTEQGFGVGFFDSTIYVSARHELHNFPEKNRLELPEKVVGLVCVGDFVFILTDGKPYRMNVSAAMSGGGEGAEVDTTLDPLPYDENFPCLTRFAAVKTNFGCVYPSRRGLVALAPNGAATIISRDRIDERDWVEWVPSLAVWVDGKYHAAKVGTAHGWVMDVVDNSEGGLDLGDLVTVDWDPVAAHMGRDGAMYYLDAAGQVATWERGLDPMVYRWRSKTFRNPELMTWAAGKISGDYGPPITLRIFRDGKLAYTRQVANGQPFRLPPLGRAVYWAYEIEGTTPVHEIHLATSLMELAEPTGG